MALSPSASEASKLLEAALEQMDGIIQGAKFDHNPQHQQRSTSRSPVSEALRALHTCLLQDDSGADHLANLDAQSIEFVFNWLRNNLLFDPSPLAGQAKEDHFDNSSEHYQFQIQMLNEQMERQNTRIVELEQLLSAKNELLRKTEAALERERNSGMYFITKHKD